MTFHFYINLDGHLGGRKFCVPNRRGKIIAAVRPHQRHRTFGRLWLGEFNLYTSKSMPHFGRMVMMIKSMVTTEMRAKSRHSKWYFISLYLS